MKIKRQFTILTTFIVAIPLICVIFLQIEGYLKSHDRYLINQYKETKNLEENKDYVDAIEILEQIPTDVESILVAIDNYKVIYNSIPELKDIKSLDELQNILEASADDYYYQFTSPESYKPTILITRMPRAQLKKKSYEKLLTSVFIIFYFCIFICIISIFAISKTISNSIITIKNKTKEIANGNLDEVIITKPNNKDLNEIMSILESIEKMRQSLSEAANRKNKFIMGISHDLRTPVAIIKGYTEAITDKVITEKNDVDNALALIHSKTEVLEDMINDLINYTKLHNYELKENLVESSITDLIQTFAKESKLSANVFKRNVVCSVTLNENIKIPLNKQLIMRALENIFGNALKYTKDGDTITIQSYINVQNNDKSIILIISDTGIGISDEDLPHIFDLFYKSSGSRQGKSMGIGLAVVKSIFDTHGWKIEVQSKKDNGTKFIITIPIN